MSGNRNNWTADILGGSSRARPRFIGRPPYSHPPFDYSSAYDRHVPANGHPQRMAQIRSWMDPVAQRALRRTGGKRGRGGQGAEALTAHGLS